MSLFGRGDPIGFEDEAEGHSSQRRLGEPTFEAAFGHGQTITRDAAARVRRAAGQRHRIRMDGAS